MAPLMDFAKREKKILMTTDLSERSHSLISLLLPWQDALRPKSRCCILVRISFRTMLPSLVGLLPQR